MQFIFILLFIFNLILILINTSFGLNPESEQQLLHSQRKCKFYSSDIADDDSDPECGRKDSTFCFSLWRISSHHEGERSYSHSHGINSTNLNGTDEGTSISSITQKSQNSTTVTTRKVEFIKQGCWEASPKSSCDSKNCTSIIRTNSKTGDAEADNAILDQQFFCCCSGDYCNEQVHLIEKDQDEEDDYLDQLDERLAYDGHDNNIETHSSRNRWMLLILIFLAIVFGICFGFMMIFCWLKNKQSIKTKDEEMVEVEEKLIANNGYTGGPNGLGGVIVLDGLDGKNWQLSKDETIVLGNEIAKGKYATVFNGKVGGSNVALKIFSSEHIDVYKNERWVLETLTKFKSDRIIKYHGWQELGGASGLEMIIVLDRIQPGSLRNYLCSENLNLTLEQCLKITCGIVEGISVLHGSNPDGEIIAHRDLTTKNILIDTELNTYITDFGLSLKAHGSKYTHGGNFAGIIEKQAETSNLCEAGTLRYMAPELLEGAVNLKDCENSLKQIDIYSLAIIIWEVINLCGDLVLNVGHKLPFHELGKEVSMESLTRAVVMRRQRPTFTNWRDHLISRQLRETIVDSWDPEPEARLTSLCILERLHDLALLSLTNATLLSGLKASEEPLESKCYNDEEIWISRNPNLERNLLFGKNGDDSASSTQYLVTMSDKHRPPLNNLNSSSSMNNPNSVSHNNHHNNNHNNLHHHHRGHQHHHHHPNNNEQSISTDGGESMTTMNTELSSASLTNFVQNVL